MELTNRTHDIVPTIQEALKLVGGAQFDEALQLLFSLRDDPQLANAFEHEWRQWSAARLSDARLTNFVAAAVRSKYSLPGLWSSLFLFGGPGEPQARQFGSLLFQLKLNKFADADLIAMHAIEIVSSRCAHDGWPDTVHSLSEFIKEQGLTETFSDRMLQLAGRFNLPHKSSAFVTIAMVLAGGLKAPQWTTVIGVVIEPGVAGDGGALAYALALVKQPEALPHDAVQRYLAHMAQRPGFNAWTESAFKGDAFAQCVFALLYADHQPNVPLRHTLEAVPKFVERLAGRLVQTASTSKWDDAMKIARAVATDVQRKEVIAAVSHAMSKSDLTPQALGVWFEWAANASPNSHATLLTELASALHAKLSPLQWKAVIDAVLNSQPEECESSLARLLAVFAKPDFKAQNLAQEQIKSLIALMFRMGPNGLRQMPALFEASSVSSLACHAFFADPPTGLNLWQALTVEGFTQALTAAAISNKLFDRVPALIDYMCEHPRAWAPDSISKLATAVFLKKHTLEDKDWDNLIHLVCLLEPDDASRTVLSLCDSLQRYKLMTPAHAQRLQSTARSLTISTRLRLFVKLVELGSVSVLHDSWESALQDAHALPLSELSLCTSFVHCVLVPKPGEQMPRYWIADLLEQLPVAGTIQEALVAAFGDDHAPPKAIWDKLSAQTKSLAVLATNPKTVANLWKIAPDLWVHMPAITTLVTSDKLALWALGLVEALCSRKIGTVPAWQYVQALVPQVPHGDQIEFGVTVHLALEEGKANGWCTVKSVLIEGLQPLLKKSRCVEDWTEVFRLARSRDSSVKLYGEGLLRALNTGTLAWDKSPEVASHRAQLRAGDKSINWDCVFFGRPAQGAGSATDLQLCRFSSSPTLAPVLQTWLEAMRVAALRTVEWQAKLGKDEKKPVADKLQAVLRVLLNLVRGGGDKSIAGWKLTPTTGFTTLITQALGSEGELVLIREEILKGIVELQAKKFGLKKAVEDNVQALLELVRKADAHAAEALAQAHTSLQLVVQAPNFKAMSDTFYFYTAEILNKDTLDCLWLGQDVSCCLSPTGVQKTKLLERLVGPWVLVAVKNERGEVVAIAWCVLCKESPGAAPVLVCDFVDARVSFRKQVTDKEGRDVLCPDGRMVLDNLLGLAMPQARAAVGAARLYIAWPIPYQRILGYAPEGSARAMPVGALKILGPDLFGMPYTDRIRAPDATYYRP